MQFFDSLPASQFSRETALAIGTFDGVHRGHAALVQRLKCEAQARGLAACVLTFDDLPYRFFNPDAGTKLLTLAEEKRTAFGALSLDVLWILHFDEWFANQPAEQFARAVLREKLNVRLLVCGPDFALGRGRDGTVEALRTLGQKLGFEVVPLEEKMPFDGAPISSTRVRDAVEAGEIERGGEMLGRLFSVAGEVVSGDRLGRTIGFPTINVLPHPMKVLPARGVYAVCAKWRENGVETSRAAALNIGLRPTVDGTKQQIEFHVLDEEIVVPPRAVEIEFVKHLRDEQKFVGLDELATQLKRDVEDVREALK